MTASLIDGTRLLGGRGLLKMARNPASVLSAILFPLLFFALFNVVMRRIMDARGFDYRQLLPPTIVVQAMLFVAISSAYYVADDRLTGISDRLRSMPVHPAAPFTGRALAEAGRAVISVVVVLAVGVATGMRFDAGPGWIPVYVAVAVVFAVGCSLGLGLIGYTASSPESASAIASMPYLPLLMLSTGFVPVEDFPSWLQPFVEWQPVTVTIDALRALAGDGSIASTVPTAFAWSIGLILVFGALGARAVRRSS